MLTIEQAMDRQSVYRAREEFRQPLGDTILNAFVGPTGTGKNFLMQKSGLPVTGTATTREKRSSDGPDYRYVSVEEMLDKIEHGELVQYGAYPPNIYASELIDYTLDEPNAADIYYNAVEALKNKGFEQVRTVSIVTPRDQWMSQLAERFEGMEIGTIRGRLDEARHSLRWIRCQHLGVRAADHLVILNRTDNVTENSDKIRVFATGKHVPSPDDESVTRYIKDMEHSITTMYGRVSG